MRTWFCKDTQRWVSEIPRAFWLGVGYIIILIAIVIYLLYKQVEKY